MSPSEPGKVSKDIDDSVDDLSESVGDQVKTALGSAKDRAADLASKGRDTAADFAATAKQSLRDAADQIPRNASDAVGMGGDLYARGSDEVTRQVRKQPLEALLLAGAIGFLVGWAVNRS